MSAPPLRLHWSPDSANIVIRIALERFRLPFEAVRLDRTAGAHRHPAYLALNPQGLIPVLEDGDLVLFETGAILLHLCERVGRFAPEGPLTTDPQTRAVFLRWIFYLSNTVHADLRIVFYPHKYHSDPADREVLRQAAAQRFGAHLALLEAQMGEVGGLLGPVTVVDDYLGAMIRWAQIYPAASPALASLAPFPKLGSLLAEIERDAPLLQAFRAEFVADPRPLTQPSRPDLPATEVTGGA